MCIRDRVDDDLGIGLLVQGRGEEDGVDAHASVVAAPDRDDPWSPVLRGALLAAHGARLGWRTEFDRD